jgi:hypothetical protein
MGSLHAFLDRNSRGINIALDLCLFAACLICYALLILLFLTPSIFQLDPLVHPTRSTIKPTVVVALLNALLTAATSALVTRAVEHSFWLKLAPRQVQKRLTIGETYQLAQWSISPLARLWYIFVGRAWALKFGGLFLIGLAAINPVIVSGISQHDSTAVATTLQNSQGYRWIGWLDASNERYNGGEFQDTPTTLAALVSMRNQSAPAADVCAGDPLCTAHATVTAVQATCEGTATDNPDMIGTDSVANGLLNQTFCSTLNTDICTTLMRGSPFTYANFSAGFPANCDKVGDKCPGAFATIFGVYVNDPGSSLTTSTLNSVECALEFGTSTVSQIGFSTPSLVPGSFRKSTNQTSDVIEMNSWHRIYTSEASNSPFTFDAIAVGTGANSLFKNPLAFSLLGRAANASADTVANRIVKSFEMATLMAFSRRPSAADIEFKIRSRTSIYTYDPRVLLILLAPVLATVLSVCLGGRWRVGGAEEVVGYDPIEIAKRGPVVGLDEYAWEDRHEVEKWDVSGWRDGVANGEGAGLMRGKMATASVVATESRVARNRFAATVSS